MCLFVSNSLLPFLNFTLNRRSLRGMATSQSAVQVSSELASAAWGARVDRACAASQSAARLLETLRLGSVTAAAQQATLREAEACLLSALTGVRGAAFPSASATSISTASASAAGDEDIAEGRAAASGAARTPGSR